MKMRRPKSATVDLKVRMKEPLRAKIESSAKKHGVSLNAEIVRRTEESFRKEDRDGLIVAKAVGGIYASFGGLPTFQAMRFLADAISLIETRTGDSWETDPKTCDEVEKACRTIFAFFRPKHGRRSRDSLFAEGIIATESDHLGAEIATKVVSEWLDRVQLVRALKSPPKRTKRKSKAQAADNEGA